MNEIIKLLSDNIICYPKKLSCSDSEYCLTYKLLCKPLEHIDFITRMYELNIPFIIDTEDYSQYVRLVENKKIIRLQIWKDEEYDVMVGELLDSRFNKIIYKMFDIDKEKIDMCNILGSV